MAWRGANRAALHPEGADSKPYPGIARGGNAQRCEPAKNRVAQTMRVRVPPVRPLRAATGAVRGAVACYGMALL